VTRKRAGLILLLAAALLPSAVSNAFAQQAAGTTGAQLQSAPGGTTGAQEATSCPTPRLSGLPKSPKFTNATIHFTLSNLTVGSTYLVTAGNAEVLGGVVDKPTMKNSFLLPDQGPKNKKIFVKTVLYSDSCDNAPWKLQKKITFKSTTAPAPATPATPATPPAATPNPAAAPAKGAPVPPVALPKVKLPKPITQRAREGEVPGARVIERNVLEWRLDPASPDRIPEVTDHDQVVVVLCSAGYTSSLAAATLQDMGFRSATDVAGGFQAWKAAGLPVG